MRRVRPAFARQLVVGPPPSTSLPSSPLPSPFRNHAGTKAQWVEIMSLDVTTMRFFAKVRGG